MCGYDRIRAGVTAFVFLVLAGLAGCATTASSIDSGAALSRASDGGADALVFGKLRLLRNGSEVALGDGFFANGATLHIDSLDGGAELIGKVGKDGDFSWMLAPGDYRVTDIGFHYHGQKILMPTNFGFRVSADHGATYVGTVTLEATMEPGHMGLSSTVDRYTVSDECRETCEGRMTALGLSADDATVALFDWQERFATTN